MSFEEIDKLFGTDGVQSGYDALKKRYSEGDKDPEVLWRLAKFCHELANRTKDKGTKKRLIFEGKAFALEGHHANENEFFPLRWAAIMTGLSTDYLGPKERIEEGSKFKALLDKAIAMDAKEYSLLHSRGRFAYTIANLTWVERKFAEIFFATPPTATMEEALEDFLAANEEKPEWIANLIYIIRIYFAKHDKENAKKYCNILLAVTPIDEEEKERVQEARKILARC
ncbi:unnamed protein product [Cylicocyclus nassatus]|uniref:Uncharacterized protein n=1 Tax=Cylicocyclus nassatus TaxID=53992 RepID=A0AA36DK84_CYLNA|nr:unnamed protein product [Cylicocyclus nassatus]